MAITRISEPFPISRPVLRNGYVYGWALFPIPQASAWRFFMRYTGGTICGVLAKSRSDRQPHAGRRRLAALIPLEALKLAAGAVILSPFIPLLFMGEEYGEPSPFLYFVSHHDPELIDAVREGRRKEFEAFHSSDEPPDPADAETFRRSVLDWKLRNSGTHAMLLRVVYRSYRIQKTAFHSNQNGWPSNSRSRQMRNAALS